MARPTLLTSIGRSRAAVRPAGTPGVNFGILYAVVLVVGVLYVAREVLVPLVLATLLAFVLAPPVRWLRHLRLPRGVAVLLAVVLAFAVLGLIGLVMGRQMAQLAGDLPRYQAVVADKLGGLTSDTGLLVRVTGMLQDLGHRLGDAPGAAHTAPSGTTAGPEPMPVQIRQPDPGPLEMAQRVLGPLVGPVATTGIVVIFVIFLLMYREDLRDRLIKLMGTGDLQRTTAALDDAADRLSRYFLAQTGVAVGFGIFVAGALYLIGIPNAPLWGVIAGMMRFVPFIGGFIAAAFPALLGLAVDPGWGTALWVIALFLVLEPVMGNVVEPLLYGHSTGLSPLALLVATAFWAWLWGPLGMLLATPLTVGMVVLGRHVAALEFLDVMLGDRAALEPAEAFYQRVLAGDDDGLAEQAELRLENEPLASYYDEVAVPGMALAQADAARGSLDQNRVDTMRGRVGGLVETLSGHEDAEVPLLADGPVAPAAGEEVAPEPPPATLPDAWRDGAAVLCIAGRGVFDTQASTMLQQVLERQGFGVRTLRVDGLRAAAGTAPLAVVFSTVAGGSGAVTVRHALRRARRMFPGARMMIGVWGAPREQGPATELKDEGAPVFTSLRGAREALVQAATDDPDVAGKRAAA